MMQASFPASLNREASHRTGTEVEQQLGAKLMRTHHNVGIPQKEHGQSLGLGA